jgi:hypothetical protein
MASAPSAMLYAGGPLYPGYTGKPPFNLDQLIENLTGSFDTVTAYTLHISVTGDLVYNDTENLLVSKDQYVGNPDFPTVFQTLYEQAGVRRFLFCVQAPLERIKELGTSPTGILAQNFTVLKNSFPWVAGIDLDFEVVSPDTATLTAFAQMLIEIGWQITFSTGGQDLPPYSACFANLFKMYPQQVTRFHMQSYLGDDGDTQRVICYLAQELDISTQVAATFVSPGITNRNTGSFQGFCPIDAQNLFCTWGSLGVQEGFIYLYDSIINQMGKNLCPNQAVTCQAYAQSIRDGISSSKGCMPLPCPDRGATSRPDGPAGPETFRTWEE